MKDKRANYDVDLWGQRWEQAKKVLQAYEEKYRAAVRAQEWIKKGKYEEEVVANKYKPKDRPIDRLRKLDRKDGIKYVEKKGKNEM